MRIFDVLTFFYSFIITVCMGFVMISCVPILQLLIRNHSSVILCQRLIAKRPQNIGSGKFLIILLGSFANRLMTRNKNNCFFLVEMMLCTKRRRQRQQQQQQLHRHQPPAKHLNVHYVDPIHGVHCVEDVHSMNTSMMMRIMMTIILKRE